MKKGLVVLSIATVAFLSGCTTNQPTTGDTSTMAQNHSIKFDAVKVPTTDAEKRSILSSKYIEVDGVKTPVSFNTIIRSGDKVGDGIFGLLYDEHNQPIKAEDGSLKISNSNDFASLHAIGDKIFMISHFESRPAAMYITELSQDKKGFLKPISTKNIDFSKFEGLWVPCAGSVTPWGSHLGSEEYEPDAKLVKDDGSINPYYDAMGDYFDGNLKKLNPYRYGWTPEVTITNDKGDVKVDKHYSMGRFAHELSYVMPDQKTVYLSDDGTNVGLFMFVADKAGDLSSGTLYAAKWEQRSSRGAGSADLKWISLGNANNATIKKALDNKVKFSDIFEVSKEAKEGFTSINTTMGQEYLKIKPGMEEIASRLETRRYAAMLGATTEFRKMEGITYNPNENILYISMSSVGQGMEDNMKKGKPNTKYDKGGNNDITLKYNPCGAVYALNMISFSKPSSLDGFSIDSKYVANFMYSLVEGTPDKSLYGNTCAINSLANPDNITFIPNTKTLIIGEDTGSGHQNDSIWSYNIANKELTRIQTTPYGSETTSPYYYNNINGYGYIMSVVQHPYGEEDALTSEEDMPKNAKSPSDMKAYTGYVGPLPVISK